jgi:hypothetical protein
MRTLLIALSALLASGSAHATVFSYQSGNKLHALCTGQGAANRAHVMGYILGVADTHNLIVSRGAPQLVCVPKEATTSQISDAVCKYLVDNPQKRHFAGSSVVLAALEAAFSCGNDAGKP